ncbi:MAG: hypothetical protein JWN11_2526 [Hyphomicrobiales bacterium]|nr:hypothetical protein [Hyphomicrobiales bacterium]
MPAAPQSANKGTGAEAHPAKRMTFAVIKTGGKQYKVAANDVLKIEKLEAEAGTIVTFDQVLLVGDENGTTVGAPLVEGALVAAEFIDTKKQKTVIILKKNRRHNYRRRNGHRQLLSTVRITEILIGGAQPTIAARAQLAQPANDAVTDAPAKKAAPKAKAAATADTEAKTPAKKAPAKKAAPKADQE